jgi:hypothetical protein
MIGVVEQLSLELRASRKMKIENLSQSESRGFHETSKLQELLSYSE